MSSGGLDGEQLHWRTPGPIWHRSGRAEPSWAEPSQVSFKKIDFTCGLLESVTETVTQTQRGREREVKQRRLLLAPPAGCRGRYSRNTLRRPDGAEHTHPAGGAPGQRRSQACCVHPLESRNTEASSVQTICLFCFVHVQASDIQSFLFDFLSLLDIRHNFEKQHRRLIDFSWSIILHNVFLGWLIKSFQMSCFILSVHWDQKFCSVESSALNWRHVFYTVSV